MKWRPSMLCNLPKVPQLKWQWRLELIILCSRHLIPDFYDSATFRKCFAAVFVVCHAASVSPWKHVQVISWQTAGSRLPPGHQSRVQSLNWLGFRGVLTWAEISLPVWQPWEVPSSAHGDRGCMCKEQPSIARGFWPTVLNTAPAGPTESAGRTAAHYVKPLICFFTTLEPSMSQDTSGLLDSPFALLKVSDA